MPTRKQLQDWEAKNGKSATVMGGKIVAAVGQPAPSKPSTADAPPAEKAAVKAPKQSAADTPTPTPRGKAAVPAPKKTSGNG